MIDKKDRARKKPADKMLVVDVETLVFGAIEQGIEVGITSSSPTLHSSSAPSLSTKADPTYEKSPLTRATILTFG